MLVVNGTPYSSPSMVRESSTCCEFSDSISSRYFPPNFVRPSASVRVVRVSFAIHENIRAGLRVLRHLSRRARLIGHAIDERDVPLVDAPRQKPHSWSEAIPRCLSTGPRTGTTPSDALFLCPAALPRHPPQPARLIAANPAASITASPLFHILFHLLLRKSFVMFRISIL